MLSQQHQIISQQSITKKRQYQSKIEQFLPSSFVQYKQLSNLSESQIVPQQTHHSHKQQTTIQKQKHLKQKQKHQLKIKNQRISVHQDEGTSIKSYNSSKLNRKTSINSNLSQLHHQAQNQSSNHHKLLTQIQVQIQNLNQKITSSISQQQNTLLQQYEDKLKSRQVQLNKLKLITNDEMIKQKTIQRKQQLKRQKKALIEGNFYYDQKLKELKKQLQSLIDKRDIHIKNMDLLGKDNYPLDQVNKKTNINLNNKIQHQKSYDILHDHNTQSKDKSNRKLNYINKNDYVQAVLRNYNQRSNILSDSLSQSKIKIQQQIPQQNSRNSYKNITVLPKISQNSGASFKKQPFIGQDYYTFRKDGQYVENVKSTGTISSIDKRSIENQYRHLIANENHVNNQIQSNAKGNISKDNERKMNKFFRYHNQVNISNYLNKNSSIDNSFIKIDLKAHPTNPEMINNQRASKTKKAYFFSQTHQVSHHFHNNKSTQNSQIMNKRSIFHHQSSDKSKIKPSKTQDLNLHALNKKISQQKGNIQHIVNSSNFNYTKQQLEQFVVKKVNKQPLKKQTKYSHIPNIQTILQKQNILNDKFNNLLKLQQLFKKTTQKYYNNKTTNQSDQNNKKIKNNTNKTNQNPKPKSNTTSNQNNFSIEQQNHDQQYLQDNQQQIQKNNINVNINKLIQKRQFDKKILMDIMFQDTEFKRYLYELIVQQQSNFGKKQAQNDLENIMKRFQKGVIESDQKTNQGQN